MPGHGEEIDIPSGSDHGVLKVIIDRLMAVIPSAGWEASGTAESPGSHIILNPMAVDAPMILPGACGTPHHWGACFRTLFGRAGGTTSMEAAKIVVHRAEPGGDRPARF
jgi:hypothetical protein